MIKFRRPTWLTLRAGKLPENVWGEDVFRYLLTAEQRRSRRSGHPFVLTILNAASGSGNNRPVLHSALPAIAGAVRETDIVGWIEEPDVLGIIFTQLDSARTHPNIAVLQDKLNHALHREISPLLLGSISISSHIFTDPLETLLFENAGTIRGHSAAIQLM